MNAPQPWKRSLHGGHSRPFCDHAHSSLDETIQAAIQQGYTTFGVTEHAPRVEPERLYQEELDLGWDVATVRRLFTEYASLVDRLRGIYGDQITLLKGFEAEVVPEDRYGRVMTKFRDDFDFDYVVGSVHFVAGHIIDYIPAEYAKAVAVCGGVEHLAVRYYQTVAEMLDTLRPEVVGHFDLVRARFANEEEAATPVIHKAAMEALEAARACDAIIDVNTAGYRKGLGRPFPAPWIVTAARDMGLTFCFGDDSHRVDHVGAHLEEARDYLLELGVRSISVLEAENGKCSRREIALD